LRPALGELLADAFWTPPHWDDLNPPLPYLAQGELTLDAGLVELPQDAGDRGSGGSVPEPVGHNQAPMPVLPRIGLRVAGREQHGRFDITAQVVNAQVELEIGPVTRQRVDDLFEGLGKRHPREPIGAGLRIDGMAVETSENIESGYRRARETAVAVRREAWSSVEVKGSDAVDFLQGQVTNDVAALEPGRGCYALVLNPKGRILGDMRVLMRSPEELWLDGEAMEAVVANLSPYKIGRRVEIVPVAQGNRDLASVVGPMARQAIGVDPSSQEHAFVDVELGGAKAVAVTTDQGLDLIFASSDRGLIEDAIALDYVSHEVVEILRIESGRPRLGIDMSDENLPGELGLEERAISFTKGCYVGQEPVARMYHRGHPNRHLRGLELSREARGGEAVTRRDGDAGGATVGSIGSATVSPTFGPIALSVVRREVEPGAPVLVGDAPAKVVALPFSSD
jgi:tRNA-modifying protein YgfZ